LAEDLGVAPAIVTVPFLERDVLAAIYRRAALLLHTAEAEGFGLPLIEAMACGCPVLASDLPVLREVGGEAVDYCPVAGVEAWANSAIRLLAERTRNEGAWDLRVQAGLERAQRFSWSENARQTARIYGQILDQSA
jgi:glycosyltransferase involved in cell wall biosynthesis